MNEVEDEQEERLKLVVVTPQKYSDHHSKVDPSLHNIVYNSKTKHDDDDDDIDNSINSNSSDDDDDDDDDDNPTENLLLSIVPIHPSTSSKQVFLSSSRGNNTIHAHENNNTVVMKTLPLSLGRQNTAQWWWKACSCNRKYNISRHRKRKPCAKYCMALAKSIEYLSKAFVTIDSKGRMKVIGKNRHLVRIIQEKEQESAASSFMSSRTEKQNHCVDHKFYSDDDDLDFDDRDDPNNKFFVRLQKNTPITICITDPRKVKAQKSPRDAIKQKLFMWKSQYGKRTSDGGDKKGDHLMKFHLMMMNPNNNNKRKDGSDSFGSSTTFAATPSPRRQKGGRGGVSSYYSSTATSSSSWIYSSSKGNNEFVNGKESLFGPKCMKYNNDSTIEKNETQKYSSFTKKDGVRSASTRMGENENVDSNDQNCSFDNSRKRTIRFCSSSNDTFLSVTSNNNNKRQRKRQRCIATMVEEEDNTMLMAKNSNNYNNQFIAVPCMELSKKSGVVVTPLIKRNKRVIERYIENDDEKEKKRGKTTITSSNIKTNNNNIGKGNDYILPSSQSNNSNNSQEDLWSLTSYVDDGQLSYPTLKQRCSSRPKRKRKQKRICEQDSTVKKKIQFGDNDEQNNNKKSIRKNVSSLDQFYRAEEKNRDDSSTKIFSNNGILAVATSDDDGTDRCTFVAKSLNEGANPKNICAVFPVATTTVTLIPQEEKKKTPTNKLSYQRSLEKKRKDTQVNDDITSSGSSTSSSSSSVLSLPSFASQIERTQHSLVLSEEEKNDDPISSKRYKEGQQHHYSSYLGDNNNDDNGGSSSSSKKSCRRPRLVEKRKNNSKKLYVRQELHSVQAWKQLVLPQKKMNNNVLVRPVAAAHAHATSSIRRAIANLVIAKNEITEKTLRDAKKPTNTAVWIPSLIGDNCYLDNHK